MVKSYTVEEVRTVGVLWKPKCAPPAEDVPANFGETLLSATDL